MAKIDLEERVTTGIKELDEMTSGGLIKNTVTLIAGPSGSGKTLLGLTFLYAGAKLGENGLYVSLEEGMNGIRAAAKSIGLKDIDDLLEKRKIVIFDIGGMRLRDDFKEKMSVKNILNYIQSLATAAEFKFDRIVIDSVAALSPSYSTESELRRALFELFVNLREEGVTTIAITEVEEKEKTTRFGEAYLADTVIRLSMHPRLTEKSVFSIYVHKMRYSRKDSREYQYSITDEGIKISTQPIAW